HGGRGLDVAVGEGRDGQHRPVPSDGLGRQPARHLAVPGADGAFRAVQVAHSSSRTDRVELCYRLHAMATSKPPPRSSKPSLRLEPRPGPSPRPPPARRAPMSSRAPLDFGLMTPVARVVEELLVLVPGERLVVVHDLVNTELAMAFEHAAVERGALPERID